MTGADLETALARWVRARRAILTFGENKEGFKEAWRELSDAEWNLAAFAKSPAQPGATKENNDL